MGASLEFYDALAPLFDVMTDWDTRLAAEGPFLRAVLEQAGARRVLDAACGSGGHALALAQWGYEVTGADPSPVMVQMAAGKASAQAGRAEREVPFLVAGLADLPAIPGLGTFDAALCLGNSLPHLLTQAELVAGLRGIAEVLEPGGLFVTQNLNYDLRWQRQPRWFAAQGGELDGQEVLVWRFADYDVAAGQVAFHIALFRKGTDKGSESWQVEVHTTPQRPLFQADLLAALSEAGFDEVQSYASMSASPRAFDPATSGDLVVVARKKDR